jgi:hypothetical protein
MDIHTLRAFHDELRKLAAVPPAVLEEIKQTGSLMKPKGTWSLMGAGGAMSESLARRIMGQMKGRELADYTELAAHRAGQLLEHARPAGLPMASTSGSGTRPIADAAKTVVTRLKRAV